MNGGKVGQIQKWIKKSEKHGNPQRWTEGFYCSRGKLYLGNKPVCQLNTDLWHLSFIVFFWVIQGAANDLPTVRIIILCRASIYYPMRRQTSGPA